ncbi:hypothetical protein ACFWMV_29850 [Streptomyces mutabilis]|uniref:hypothetical protein n=1 Tax=Streptomyces mutabilis TaxID=67332 RepID=UPI0036476A8D
MPGKKGQPGAAHADAARRCPRLQVPVQELAGCAVPVSVEGLVQAEFDYGGVSPLGVEVFDTETLAFLPSRQPLLEHLFARSEQE